MGAWPSNAHCLIKKGKSPPDLNMSRDCVVLMMVSGEGEGCAVLMMAVRGGGLCSADDDGGEGEGCAVLMMMAVRGRAVQCW